MTLLLIPNLQHFGSPVVIYFFIRETAALYPLTTTYSIRKMSLYLLLRIVT